MVGIRLLAVTAFLLLQANASNVVAGADAKYTQKIPGDNAGYPDDSDYLTKRVLGAAICGILIAILSCVCGCCFCCVQVCAKCGCECIKKCCPCCGARDPDPEGYTQKQRLCLVVVLCIGWAFIVTGSGLGYDGNAKVADGLEAFKNNATSIASEIYDQVKMSYDAAVLVSTSTIDSSMVTDAEKLKKDVNDAAKTLEETDEIRVLSVYVFYAIMMVVPLLGFLSWLCGSSKLSYIMTQVCHQF